MFCIYIFNKFFTFAVNLNIYLTFPQRKNFQNIILTVILYSGADYVSFLTSFLWGTLLIGDLLWGNEGVSSGVR
jgi:hypothetical protein